MSDTPISTDAIQDWLIDLLASYLEIPVDEVDPVKNLVQHGVDSMYRWQIREDVEMQFGIKLDPKLMTGESEISDVAGLIHAQLAGHSGG